MYDPRPRVSRPLAMLSVVLLMTLAFAPNTLAAPPADDQPTITFDGVIDWLAGLMSNVIDAASGVFDVNGQPAPPPPPPTPDSPDDPSGDGGEGSAVFEPNG